ncbi:MAG: hypothetical protein D6731_13480, partial [Planctomycetota bacterium]
AGAPPPRRKKRARLTQSFLRDQRLGQTAGDFVLELPLYDGRRKTDLFHARHPQEDLPTLVQLFSPEPSEEESFRIRFQQRLRLLQDVGHPGLLKPRAFGERDDGSFFVAYAGCPEQTLAGLLRDEDVLAPERAATLLRQLLDAVGVLHEAGLVHGELRTGTIGVDRDEDAEHAWVIGVGLLDEGRGEPPTGLHAGVAKYLSPEQARGEPPSSAADVYSLGLVLYECLTGRLPWTAFFSAELLRKRQEEDPLPPSQQGVDIPEALESIVLRALARNPEDRFRSADEFQYALEVFLGAARPLPEPLGDALQLGERLELHRLGPSLAVHRARHPVHGAGLAWISAPARFERKSVHPFVERVQELSKLAHPSLAPVLAAGLWTNTKLYAFSAAAEGPTLEERMRAGPMAEAEVLGIARPLLEGLATAHAQGVAHGAIEPALIVLGERRPVLHGIGVRPAATGKPSYPSQDTREVALLMLEMLSGLRIAESRTEPVRRAALERCSEALAPVLDSGSRTGGYADAGELLAALPAPRSPVSAFSGRRLAAAAVALLVCAACLAAWTQREALRALGRDLLAGSPASDRPVPPTGDSPTEDERAARLAAARSHAKLRRDEALATGAAERARDLFARAEERWRVLSASPPAAPAAYEEVAAAFGEAKAVAEARAALDAARTTLGSLEERARAARARAEELGAAELPSFRTGTEALHQAGSAPPPDASSLSGDALTAAREEVARRNDCLRQAAEAFERATKVAAARQAADDARSAALAAGAARICAQEFADADRAYRAAIAATGGDAIARAQEVAKQFQALARLAKGRRVLMAYAKRLRRIRNAVATLQRNVEALPPAPERRLTRARAQRVLIEAEATQVPPVSTVSVDRLRQALEAYKRSLAAWRKAFAAYREAEPPRDDRKEIEALLSRYRKALATKDGEAIRRRFYLDARRDRDFYERIFSRGSEFALELAGPPRIQGDAAEVDVERLAYTWTARKRRVAVRGLRVYLRRNLAGKWKIVSVRRPR